MPTVKIYPAERLKLAASASFACLQAAPAFAQADLGIETANFGLPNANLTDFIGSLTRTALGFVGIIMVLNIMHAGFLIMTHDGNEEKRIAAVKAFRSSVVGLIIILSAGSLAKFAVTAIINATGYAGPLS